MRYIKQHESTIKAPCAVYTVCLHVITYHLLIRWFCLLPCRSGSCSHLSSLQGDGMGGRLCRREEEEEGPRLDGCKLALMSMTDALARIRHVLLLRELKKVIIKY